MKFNIDTTQRINITLSFLLEFYKISMGTLLIMFVPQMCYTKPCTIVDNITMSTTWEMVCVVFNFISWISVLCLYVVELKREHYAIEFLDVECDKPNNFLDTEIENYPEIKNKITIINTKYNKIFRFSVLLNILNLILSTIVIYDNYLGISTITAYSSYLILLCSKYYNVYFVSSKSLKEERMYSGYMKTLVTYNTIDKDHRNINNNINNNIINNIINVENIEIELSEKKEN
jgi:hypothetical protein